MENKNVKIIKIGLVIVYLLFNVASFESNTGDINSYSENFNKNLKAANSEENTIFIDAKATGLNAHNWSWAALQDWCNGTGTEFDPYRISHLTINGMGVNNCIEIRNSNIYYFIIDHCVFYNAGNSNPHKFAANIFLNNSKYGKIKSNEIIGASSDLAMGVYMENCTYMHIQSNNISQNHFYGIHLSHSYASNITDNIIQSNIFGGISVQDNSQTINIANNLVDQNNDGIGISGSSHNWIYNNTIRNSYIDGIICVDCYNIGIFSNIISFNAYGIYIQESSVISISWVNIIEENEYGIIFKLSHHSIIQENIIVRNNNYPLYLYSSNYNRISRNVITQNKETLTQIDCIGNQLIDNVVFNRPEKLLLTFSIIGIVFFVLVVIIIFRKWKKKGR